MLVVNTYNELLVDGLDLPFGLAVVKTYVNSTIGTFTKRDAMENCPSLGSSSVESALKKLVEDGTIIRKGLGRASHYSIILEKMRLNNYYILKIYDESFLIFSVHEQTIMGLTEFEI